MPATACAAVDLLAGVALALRAAAVGAGVVELGPVEVDVAAPEASGDVRRRGGITRKTSDVTPCREG